MRNVLLWLRYDGSRFHGYQRQDNARTVQGELEKALAKMFGDDYALATSSRTDSGVHGWRHPVSILTHAPYSIEAIKKALNATTPLDLAIIDAFEMPRDFNIRKGSVAKTYQYRIYQRRYIEPFLEPYAWRIAKPLDLENMRDAAGKLVGEHDFSSFRTAGCDAKSPIRVLHAVHIHNYSSNITITLNGNAFLRNMVRIIVGSLTEIGVGRFPPEWIDELLDACDRTQAGRTAPARGLFLMDVCFPTELFASGAHGW